MSFQGDNCLGEKVHRVYKEFIGNCPLFFREEFIDNCPCVFREEFLDNCPLFFREEFIDTSRLGQKRSVFFYNKFIINCL